MFLSDFTFSSLSIDGFDSVNDFDCNDEAINQFFRNEALKYQIQKITNTYIFKDELKIVAFFSISNDCLRDLGYEQSFWNRFHRKVKIPNRKRIRQYPAVKVTRLGINKEYQNQGLSHQLLDFIKGWTFIGHKPACRLLILDAYNQSKQRQIYEKNDFVYFSDSDKYKDNRFMYFDLMRLE